MGFRPSLWASVVPRHPGEKKPNHYLDMARVAWQNRDQLGYAWRILNHGVCDGCALGTTGMHDWTIGGIHLCMVRLELMRLNTAPALDPALLADAAALSRRSSADLRALGRLPEPMIRRKGERGFRVVTWEEAYGVMVERIRKVDPKRFAVYLTSRGIMNEHYYAAQKAARAMGTSHVDNSARLCHAASTVGMKKAVGYGASTCTYKDWIGTDLIVFFGSNTPNNQPVTTKYLYEARLAGTKVAVVNPYHEPGLRRYWVPSVTESAIFGTKLSDTWFPVNIGGDLAFLLGTLRILAREGWMDRGFIARDTIGFEEAIAASERPSWEEIERESGSTVTEMERFARLLWEARSGIFVWSMGLTQHSHGVETISALMNVGLARGWVGREKVGMMPIRGHSGVQGGAEVGCIPKIDDATRKSYEDAWGFRVPAWGGNAATEMIAAAYAGNVDTFWIVGGNFLETLPDPPAVAAALGKVGLRIHQDVVLTSMMLLDPADTVLILPATTRYESPGGGTETSTERRIIYSPEIAGRRVGSAKPEWEVFGEVAARVRPDVAGSVRFKSSQHIRQEIARAVPLYKGIETLGKEGDQVQWGGERLFSDGRYNTPDGKAHFVPVALSSRAAPAGQLHVTTRRGKQFNSMIQKDVDPLNGAAREDVLMAAEDARRLGLAQGDPIRLTSAHGSYDGRVFLAEIKPGNVEVHWPEGNGLLDREDVDALSLEPDYNATVRVERRTE